MLVRSNLVPGGVVQLLETQLLPVCCSDDDSIPKDGAIRQYFNAWEKAFATMGLLDVGPLLESYLRDAGFEDIKVAPKKLPVGPWPKDPKKKVC